MVDPKGGPGGLCPPPPPPHFFEFFFLQKRILLAKVSIKRVRNLSQNAGNGHFRDSNFQNFLGDPPKKLAPSVLVGSPPPPRVSKLNMCIFLPVVYV